MLGIKTGSSSQQLASAIWVKKSATASSISDVDNEFCGLTIDDDYDKIDNQEKLKDEKDDVDATSRLEELCSRVQEPQLSEDQLRINDQLQEDELLAMESIYGENLLLLDQLRGLRSFQIYIDIEAPNETLTVKLNSPNDLKNENQSLDDISYTFKVTHLPPLVLSCVLPRSYPSHIPPCFTVSVQWLNSDRISNLCAMLDSVWAEQTGQEVIYQWVEWLQSSSLSYLGFDKEIILGSYDIKESGDSRAISESISPDFVILSLKSYDEAKRHENFCKDIHQCCICYSEYAGTDFVKLPCQHFFCLECMTIYSEMHVAEGTINRLKCPDVKCEGMVPPYLLKQLLGDEKFERWETMMLQKTFDSMSDIVYCPRCETPCIEDEDEHAQCSKCFFSFCTLCKEKRHVGAPCMTPELQLSILEKRQSEPQLNDEQKRRELDKINEILTVKEILRNAIQCPSCKAAISKDGGCNKMTCRNCGKHFCFICNKAVVDYDHFREGKCKTYSALTTRQQRQHMEKARNTFAPILAPLRALQRDLFIGRDRARFDFCPTSSTLTVPFPTANNYLVPCPATISQIVLFPAALSMPTRTSSSAQTFSVLCPAAPTLPDHSPPLPSTTNSSHFARPLIN
ncbi:hypothetical protein ACFE04_014589 [Oxalis oulophora]